MGLIINHWEIVLAAVLLVDKIVAATPNKYDDLILTSIKSLASKLIKKEV